MKTHASALTRTFSATAALLLATAQAEPETQPITSPTFSRPATLLLITDASLTKAWAPFAKWKTQIGKSTKVITIAEIDATYQGDIIQEKIRRCVRHHIENSGTRWVLLGGDCLPHGLVPGGHTTIHAMEPEGIPTDIVYLSPTDWDADGDGIYGEWEDDRQAITYPDGRVGLGRAPVRTPTDVAAFTDKVIAYESRYPTTDFATAMIYTCTDSPAYPKVRRSWDDYVSKVWKNGTVGRFFNTETPWDQPGKPGSHDLSAEHLVALFNDRKTGKLHIHGHGHLPAWVLEESYFTAENINQLTNNGAYPLITTVSCNTGEYDSATDPSIVESMIRQPGAGSVAIVAPIRTGKPHFHQYSDFHLMITEGKLDGTTMTITRYWQYGLGDGDTTGQALMRAKADMIKDARQSPGFHLCISELNLLGDPTLDMRAADPKPIPLHAPEKIDATTKSIKITTNTPGCTVCLWKADELYTVAEADAEGVVVFTLTAPLSAGEILVAASGPSLNTATTTISISAK